MDFAFEDTDAYSVAWLFSLKKEIYNKLKTQATSIPAHILPVIVFAQFAGTSLWFAGNAIVGDLQVALNLPEGSVGNITAAVQFGFIIGTLVFAVLSIADRFSPSKTFLLSAIIAAFFNSCVFWFAEGLMSLLVFRFLTGFFLAGIYPVGMKISADWYEKGLGKALRLSRWGTRFGYGISTFTKGKYSRITVG